MARRGGPRDEPDERRFPLAVFTACSGMALVLLITTTMPAVLENRALRAGEEERQRKLEALEADVRSLRGRAAALDVDPQQVLVELDRHGLTPDDFPPPEPPTGERPR